MAVFAEKKSAACCGKIVAHTKEGKPYKHTCDSPTLAERTAVNEMDAHIVANHRPVAVTPSPDLDALRRPAVDPSPLTAEAFATPPEIAPTPFPASYESECDTCDGAIYEGDMIRSDGDGGWECASHAEESEGAPCTHPNGFTWADDGKGHSGSLCTVCGTEEPSGPDAQETLCVSAEVSHVFTWNPVAGESQCIGCGTPDSGALKAERAALSVSPMLAEPSETGVTGVISARRLTAEPTHVYDDGNGGQWVHPGTAPHCPERVCTPAEPSPYVALLAAEVGDPGTVADAFSAPAAVAEKLNVSGQPDARYEWWGKQNRGYLVKLPETGDFRRYANGKPKGLARVTTFNKAASDQNAISDWNKRNVLIGASLRPDLVAKAHGLGHENDTAALMSLVAQLETAAGAKVSADIGTLIHELTEKWDAGVIDFKGVPAAYRPLIKLYNDTLKEYGLRPVRGLIERTTYIPEYGGVVGTLDRVYYHERSGQYIIGDVKTGKTLKYGMDEIETQEWIYAHGVNESGVYDWNTDTWGVAVDGCRCPHHGDNESCEGPEEITVSEEWGVVIHMPVQGDDAGKCLLVRADLQRGRRHADVCHDVRTQRSNKPKPEPWTGMEWGGPESAAEPVVELEVETAQETWELLFSTIKHEAEAGKLWERARDAGVESMELARLVELARKRLRELESAAEPVVESPVGWESLFRNVKDSAHAGELWENARNEGVAPMELNRLVQLAQQRLSELDSEPPF